MDINGNDIQIEQGEFARIHNSILGILAKARFTGSEYRCLLFLLRKTYGWQKKEDAISVSQWAEGVGVEFEKRHNVWRTLQVLVEKNVIYARDNGNNRPKTWGFNKYVETWDATLLPQTVIAHDNSSVMPDDNSFDTPVMPHDNSTVIRGDNRTVMPQDNNKRNKETIKEGEETNPLPTLSSVGQKTYPKKSFVYHNDWRAAYQPLFERLIDVYRIRPMIDVVEDEKAISAMQGIVIDLAKLGCTTVEAVDGLEKQWYATDFRGKKKEAPKARQFVEFAATQKTSAPVASEQDSPRKRMKVLS